jgi:nitroreductase
VSSHNNANLAPGAALTADQTAACLVAAAVWAPSVHNTQPWWFTADGRELSLYADVGRQLAEADPSGREMLISCGAALFTARLALRSLGWIPQATALPDRADPLLVARVSWQQRAEPATYEMRLFDQVLRRRTHRGGFDPVPLAPEFLAVLQAGARRDHAELRIIPGAAGRAFLGATVQNAEQALQVSSRHVQELAAWTSPPGSTRADGLPATAYPARPTRTIPDFPSRDFAHGHGWGLPRSSADSAARSPGVVCLLTTPADEPADWVNAGQALQRILLTSAASGVAAALHSQPLELAWLRQLVHTRITDGSYPQLLIRLGTVIQTSSTVRRPADTVLLTGATRAAG